MKGWLALTYFILFSLTTQTIFANFSEEFLDTTLPLMEKTGERPEGSQGETLFFNILTDFFKANSISYEKIPFSNLPGGHSFSQGLSVTVKGSQPDTVVVVYPVNPSRPGRLNVWAPGVLLNFLKDNPQPPITIQFLFLGAERGDEAKYPVGSRVFLEDFFPSQSKGVLYLDLDGTPGTLDLVTESGAYLSPIWLFERTRSALSKSEIPFGLRGSQPPLFRFDLPEKRTLAHSYFQKNIPAVLIQNSDLEKIESPETWPQRFYQFLNSFIQNNAQGLPKTWDRHYLYFQAGGFSFLMNQDAYLIVFIILFALLTGLAFLTKARWKPYITVLKRFFWQIPVLFIFLFLFLFLSTILLQNVQTQRQFETLWTYQPLTFLGLKMGLAVFLFLGTFFISKRIPFVRWAGFYTTAAIVSLGALLLAAVVIEISFSFYFLWALLFSLGFALVKNRGIKLAFLILSPFWFLKTSLELFLLRPDNWLNKEFLTSPWEGNLMVSLALFPFLLMVLAFHFFKYHRPDRNEGIMAFLSTLGWGLGTLGIMIFLMNFNPFDTLHKPPLEIKQTLDYAKGRGDLELRSPVPWQAFSLQIGAETWKAPAKDKRLFQILSAQERLLKRQIIKSPFLNRTNYRITWSWKGSPRTLKLALASPKTLTIYDCNFPFSIAPDGKTAEIFIGVYPPSPLNLELTLTQDQEATLDVFLTYFQHPQELTIQPPAFESSLHLTLHDVINLLTSDEGS